MIETRAETVTRQVTRDVKCDSCGASCSNDAAEAWTYLEMKAEWGYGTPWDMEDWTAQVCIACVQDKLMPIVNFQRKEVPVVPF